MRINRFIQLYPDTGTVHMYWRCHNRDFYLEDLSFKDMYFHCIERGLNYRNQKQNVQIHAFCAMGNHVHIAATYKNGCANLSNYMRYSHGIFGARFNLANNRSGKVAQGRPKTSLIQNEEHEMRVHFYIEANPIRARICKLKNLRHYHYSSYGFYAYGIRTAYSHLLTIPDWYYKLGKTPKQRQATYRKLFEKYLGEYHSDYSVRYKQRYIEDTLWVMICSKEATTLQNAIANSINNSASITTNTG